MLKQIILFSFLVFLVSCGSEEDEIENTPIACTEVEYKLGFNISLNEEVCFPDGNSLTLIDVKHHLCPCGAVCAWEGDLLIMLSTTYAEDIIDKKDFYSRSVFDDSSIFNDYEITFFSFTYNNGGEEVPECAEDFDPEKMMLTFIISEI